MGRQTKQEIEKFVKQMIAENKVVVFSQTGCPYSMKAKNALKSVLPSGKFFVVELDTRDDGVAIREVLMDITGSVTVPRVFVGGKFIGGGDDTVRLAGTGELQKLLQDVGAS